jgi:hypothetical protein
MPPTAVPHRTVRLCIALLVAAISLSSQSAAPVAAAEAVDWKSCAARPVPLPPGRAIDPTLASALNAKVVAFMQAKFPEVFAREAAYFTNRFNSKGRV